ncbi:MAG: prenyltransferase [Candidatus Promineifilaceae bacterium]|nr:prenyltransferase [Candidatus Promineifilaceae bacterium]
MSPLRTLLHLIRLGRPHFLVGGVLLHVLGVTIALYHGAALDLWALLWGQVAVSATQMMTHYSNDYFDVAADVANETPTSWSGGSRVLAEGLLAPRWALALALLFAMLALAATALLVLGGSTGPLAAPLLLLALALAWGYSAPPFTLHSRGVGELTVAFVVPVLTVAVGYYLQAGQLRLLPLLAALPLALFQFVMLLAIEFPDALGDAAVGKRTLVVRLGPEAAAKLLVTLLALVYVALPLLVVAGLPPLVALLLALFAAPLVAWVTVRLRAGAATDPRWWNWLGFVGVALVVGSATVELVAFLSLMAR